MKNVTKYELVKMEIEKLLIKFNFCRTYLAFVSFLHIQELQKTMLAFYITFSSKTEIQ